MCALSDTSIMMIQVSLPSAAQLPVQNPGQVTCIHPTDIHPLPPDRAHDVRRISNDGDPPPHGSTRDVGLYPETVKRSNPIGREDRSGATPDLVAEPVSRWNVHAFICL